MPIAVVVRYGRSHAGLLPSIFVVRGTRGDRDIRERSVVIVAVKDAGCAIARNEDVRPAVFIKVQRRHTESIMPVGAVDVRFGRDIFEGTVTPVVVEDS